MARDYSDNNWSRKFRYEPLIKVILRSILHWKKFPDNISKLFLAKKKERMFSAHTKPPKNWKSIDVSFFTSSENLSTKKPS